MYTTLSVDEARNSFGSYWQSIVDINKDPYFKVGHKHLSRRAIREQLGSCESFNNDICFTNSNSAVISACHHLYVDYVEMCALFNSKLGVMWHLSRLFSKRRREIWNLCVEGRSLLNKLEPIVYEAAFNSFGKDIANDLISYEPLPEQIKIRGKVFNENDSIFVVNMNIDDFSISEYKVKSRQIYSRTVNGEYVVYHNIHKKDSDRVFSSFTSENVEEDTNEIKLSVYNYRAFTTYSDAEYAMQLEARKYSKILERWL